MTPFEKNKLIEVVLYILNKTKGADIYHLFKILYFAQREHLAKWGLPIVTDDFIALPYGPVPEQLYNAVRKKKDSFADTFYTNVEKGSDDADNIYLAKRDANLGFISKSELEELDKSIQENQGKSFNELYNSSHDKAWQQAHHKGNGTVLSPLDIASARTDDQAILDFISNELDLERALL